MQSDRPRNTTSRRATGQHSHHRHQTAQLANNNGPISPPGVFEAPSHIGEARLRAILDNLQDAYFQADPSGRLTLVNSSAPKMFGFDSVAQMIGLSAETLYAEPKDRSLLLDVVRRARHVNDWVVQCRRNDGKVFWVSMNAQVVRDESGHIVGTEAVVRDITERKQVEDESRLLKAALEATANAIVVTNRDGKIQWTNAAFTALTGYCLEEIVGQTPRVLRSGSHPAEFYKGMWETILSGSVWRGEVINKRKDGTLYTEEMTITPIRSANGDCLQFVAVKQDVSERKRLEDQFRQAQKMEAVGTLAGGIAHDFNNLLGVVLGCVEVLEDHIGDDTTLGDLVEEIRGAVKSGAVLTGQLLAFGRRQILQPQVVSLNEVVSETVSMLRRVVGEDVIVNVQLDSTAGNVIADPGQLQQVIMNLAVNARDAMPKGGVLTVVTENINLERESPGENRLPPPGCYVRLGLRDTGMGMDEATQLRAFEPFFTTKPQGLGTGLGLATVYGIVKQSGGYVLLSSKPNEGTLVQVYLTRVRGKLRKSSGSPAKVTGGDETILLVEDSPALRKVICRCLERKGYTVISVGGGQEALEAAESFTKPIDLLITDVIMPGIDGSQLAGRLAEQRPRMRLLYMSGHTDEMLGHRGVIAPNVMFIKKPFEFTDFLTKVREALQYGTVIA